MDSASLALAEGLVNPAYIRQGAAAGLGKRRALVKALLANRRMPQTGWDDHTIEILLQASSHCADCLSFHSQSYNMLTCKLALKLVVRL
eukprot:jgi/Chlat1/8770/Chrsp90S09247